MSVPKLTPVQKTIVVVLILLLLGVAISSLSKGQTDTQKEQTRVQGIVLEESLPIRLRIPAINVDAPFVSLGLDDNKEIETPDGYEEVGWYQYGPTPGELGPAVVLGHVDSVDGPAVFYSLGQLHPGDKIEIDRADNTTAVFEVKNLERYDQDTFPTSLVYGNIDHAGLRLITCSGTYSREQQRYDKNLVVYAELVEDETQGQE